ncbi:MAG: Hsp20/alpha crystallin family protein [Candidatus Krumholzibacteriota bacterium]
MNTLFPVTRMLDAALNNSCSTWNEADGAVGRTPRADILEGEKEFRVLMDLPGVAHKDLDLSIEDQTLWVKAERTESVPEGFEARRSERSGHVTYSRTFSLGNAVNVDDISAEFKNGVLTITLPKSEKSLPRRIEVK